MQDVVGLVIVIVAFFIGFAAGWHEGRKEVLRMMRQANMGLTKCNKFKRKKGYNHE